MMSREDKLMSMNGATLIQIADKYGVKVSCNRARTQLKESKQNVIDRIIEFESHNRVEKSKHTIEDETLNTKEIKTTHTSIKCISSNDLNWVNASKKNEYYIKNKSGRATKVRKTKSYFVCYVSGNKIDLFGGEYQKKTNRTKIIVNNMLDVENIAIKNVR